MAVVGRRSGRVGGVRGRLAGWPGWCGVAGLAAGPDLMITLVQLPGTPSSLRWATTCMPCSFGSLPHPRSETRAQPVGLLEVTVVVRWIPLVPAACGTRVARPARTTMLAPGGDGSQLDGRVRPVHGDPPARGQEPGGLAAALGIDPRVLSLKRDLGVGLTDVRGELVSLPTGSERASRSLPPAAQRGRQRRRPSRFAQPRVWLRL